MNYKTEYNIGDKVYYIASDEIQSDEIQGIQINHRHDEEYFIRYFVRDKDNEWNEISLRPDQIFKSITELANTWEAALKDDDVDITTHPGYIEF